MAFVTCVTTDAVARGFWEMSPRHDDASQRLTALANTNALASVRSDVIKVRVISCHSLSFESAAPIQPLGTCR